MEMAKHGYKAIVAVALALAMAVAVAFANAFTCNVATAYADEPNATPSSVQLPTEEQKAAIKQGLAEVLEKARNMLSGVAVSEDGSDVPAGTPWITPAQKSLLEGAMAEAEKALDSIDEIAEAKMPEMSVVLDRANAALEAAKAAIAENGIVIPDDAKAKLQEALAQAEKLIDEAASGKGEMFKDELNALKTAVAATRFALDNGLVQDRLAEEITKAIDDLKEALNARVVAVPVAASGLVYNGKAQVGVAAATGYTVTGGSATNAGSYKATATLEKGYVWADGTIAPIKVNYTIAKAAQHVKAAKTAFKVKAKAVKKKAIKLAVAFSADGGGACTWEKAKSEAAGKAGKATPNKVVIAKNGKIAVKKGAKKGTYVLKVKVSAPATKNYSAASGIVQLTVKVK